MVINVRVRASRSSARFVSRDISSSLSTGSYNTVFALPTRRRDGESAASQSPFFERREISVLRAARAFRLDRAEHARRARALLRALEGSRAAVDDQPAALKVLSRLPRLRSVDATLQSNVHSAEPLGTPLVCGGASCNRSIG